MATYTLTGLRAVIHARESRFEAKAGNRSTTEQVDESRAWCETQGVEVAHVVVEENTTGAAADRSSRATERTRWEHTKRLLADGDDHGPLDLLVTWSSTRGQRDLEEYVALRRLCADAGVLWCYGGRVYDMTDGDDRFRTGVDTLVGERDVEEIRKNVNRGLRANRAGGKPHGPTLFGYRRIYDDHTGAFIRQEIDPDTAAVVRRIFALYLTGHSPRSIAERFNTEGVATSTGKGRWGGGSVRRILMNPAYTGKLTHHGAVAGDGCWPALVNAKTWRRTQARLTARRTPWDVVSQTKLLLTGLARCGVCSTRLVRQPRRHAICYVCQAGHVSRDVDRVDLYVTGRLLVRLANTYDLTEPAEDPAVVEARARTEALRVELDEAMGLWRDKRLSAQAYAEMEAHLLPQIADAERAARRAVLPIDIDVPPPDRQPAWWANTLTHEQRRELMAAWIVAVEVRPVGRGRRVYDQGEYTSIEWRR